MKILSYVLKGVLAGLCVGVGIFILGIFVELINCTCGILDCDFDRDMLFPSLLEGDTILSIVGFGTIGGLILDTIYGIYRTVIDSSAQKQAELSVMLEKERKERITRTKKIMAELEKAFSISKRNQSAAHKLYTPKYNLSTQISLIAETFHSSVELQGDVQAITGEDEAKNE